MRLSSCLYNNPLPKLNVRLLCGIFLALFRPAVSAKAQGCPPNIDFENGTFSGWTCWVGSVSAAGNTNTISLIPANGPAPDQHVLYSRATAGGFSDPYGGFPVLCPNGSNYSIKLGNAIGGAQAEGLSYEFTVPSNRNTYSLIYHYAVVFQDPNHQPFQQPRLELEITNVTDGFTIGCSSFTFFPNGSPLPGFFVSPLSDSTPVWCKDWSAVTINLNNQAGKTIRLFFKTADCTFRRHFGYAYIDVNSECSNEFTGATYCPDDTAINVIAPYGYKDYIWYDQSFSQLLGTTQSLHIAPPPPVGTTIAVELIPYNGYGCLDTLYAKLVDTLHYQANAGPDVVSCNKDPVTIGTLPKQNIVYSWFPATDLSDPNIANPLASPSVTTTYFLTSRSSGGGCVTTDTVEVKASLVDSSQQLLGKPAFCITSGDSAVLQVTPTARIQWLRNNNPINGATLPRYKALQSGVYNALLQNADGCTVTTEGDTITIETPRNPIRYPLEYAVINIPEQLEARNFGVSYLWKPPLYLDEPAVSNPYFKSATEGEQWYTVEIITAGGCMTVDTQMVKIIREVKIYVPTAFTPNNDGRNDFLKPLLVGVRELNYFRIYNRWGQLIYDMRGGQRGWDGTINGLVQPTGVYVWMVEGLGLDKQLHRQKGTTVLIR